MLTLKLQAKDFELTLLPHKFKSNQSLFQAEHFRPNKSCVRNVFNQKFHQLLKYSLTEVVPEKHGEKSYPLVEKKHTQNFNFGSLQKMGGGA